MSLDGAPAGTRFRVTRVRCHDGLAYRLMEMGIIEGSEVQLIRRAPLGDPLHLRVGDFDISLRAADAAMIDISAI